MALFHKQRGVAVALGRKVGVAWCGTGRGARTATVGIFRRTIRGKLCCLSRRSDGDTDGRRHGPHERRCALVACRLALVGRLALASGRNAAAVPAMPACRPAA
eukprot:90729-Chlamydomonas_euryale.AAC.1